MPRNKNVHKPFFRQAQYPHSPRTRASTPPPELEVPSQISVGIRLKLAEHLASVLCLCCFPVVSRCPSYSQLSVFENAFCFQHGIDHRWDWMQVRDGCGHGNGGLAGRVRSGPTSCPGPMFLDQCAVELASGKHTKNIQKTMEHQHFIHFRAG